MNQPASPGSSSPATESTNLRVLIVDMSVGFGGATKSVSLILGASLGINPCVLTSQTPDVLATWYSGLQVRRWRTLLNYRSRMKVASFLGRWLRPARASQLSGRLFALLDVAALPVHVGRLLWIATSHRIDIIHLQNGFVPDESLIAARILGIPAIVHMRGMHDGRHTVRTFGANLTIVGDSQAVCDSLPVDVAPEVPRTTVYEPVDLAAFTATEHMRDEVRAQLKLEPEEIAVGIFGRIIPWKGQREFVLAMLEAMDSNDRLRGFVVGSPSDGGPEYLAELRIIVDRSSHRDRMSFVGYTPTVEPYYHAMDIVVHASTEPEPCGMVVLEGMAARKPVVAANAGGPMELITDGEDGLLVTPGDVRLLRDAILRVANDDAARVKMGHRGRAKAERCFSVERAAHQIQQLYTSAMGPR